MYLKKGYLYKQGGAHKSWKRRWFGLEEDGSKLVLRYFANEKVRCSCKAKLALIPWPQEKDLLGSIDLTDCSALYGLASFVDGYNNVFELAVHKRDYVFSADSPEIRADWLSVLEQALKQHNVHFNDGAQEVVKMGYLDKRGRRNGVCALMVRLAVRSSRSCARARGI